MAFGFNMVDVGGILGGRVDRDFLGIASSAVAKETTRDLLTASTMPVIHLSGVSIHDRFTRQSAREAVRYAQAARSKPASEDGSDMSIGDSSHGESDGTDDTLYSLDTSSSLSSQLSAIQSVLPVTPRRNSVSFDIKSKLGELDGSPDSKLNVYIEGSHAKRRNGYRNTEQDMTIEAV